MYGGNELREKAFARIRDLKRRQADAEQMIARGVPNVVLEIHNLNLQITPELCRVTTEFLRKDADSYKPATPDAPPYSVMAYRIEQFWWNMEWLAGHGCDRNGAEACGCRLGMALMTCAGAPERLTLGAIR